MSEPELKPPLDWESRVPAGWDWYSLWEAVECGDNKFSGRRTQEAIDAGIDPKVILDDGLFPGFDHAIRRFQLQPGMAQLRITFGSRVLQDRLR